MENIVVKNLSKSFKGVQAIKDVSFSVSEGEIFGFLGPSGAGKSTTINILTGQMKSSDGSSRILQKDSHHLDSEDFCNIGILSEFVELHPKLSLYESLLFYAKFNHIPKLELDKLIEQLGLMDSKDTIFEQCSTGMRKRAKFIKAILNKPKVLFLDEPTSGLDPLLKKVVHEMIMNLKREGVTIFLTTHDMSEAEKLCDNIALLYQGKIIEKGSPDDIIQRYNREDFITLTYQNGNIKKVEKSNLKEHLSEYVTKIDSHEKSLEDIFLELTGADLNA